MSDQTATDETSGPLAEGISYDEIALRAYFIALDHHSRGEPGDPLRDWIEAERLVVAERSRKPPEA